MKTMHTINKVVIIINLILFLTFYGGLLFLMVTGAVQLILYVIYLCRWKSIKPSIKPLFVIYGILVMIALGILLLKSSEVMIISMVLGGILSIWFLILSTQQLNYHSLKLEKDEL